jgi:hypothetical protein
MQRNAINILQHLISTAYVYRFAKVDFNLKIHMSDQATFQNVILASSYSGMKTIITIIIIINHYTNNYRARGRRWLRHCATSRKVAGSIPDGVIGIFH